MDPSKYDGRGVDPPYECSECKEKDIEIAVLRSCKEEQDSGNGPCGICLDCLRNEIKKLRAFIEKNSYAEPVSVWQDPRIPGDFYWRIECKVGWGKTVWEAIDSHKLRAE